VVNPNTSVAALVAEHPSCAPILQRYRIDFCCHGEGSLTAAALGAGVPVGTLVSELEARISETCGLVTGPKLSMLTTEQLVAHIVRTHHAYLREALPYLTTLADKVGRVHGDRNSNLVVLADVVSKLSTALLEHLDEEEETLFPALCSPDVDRAWATQQLSEMRTEHESIAAQLDAIHSATEEFAIPDWACVSYRQLFGTLREVEADILIHVHTENYELTSRFTGAQV
jgi:regulator of cell morphogenesis and NO signaling